MRFRIAIITLTLLGCTVHSQSTYIEYGGEQRGAKPRRSHAATTARADKEIDASRRRSATAADEAPAVDARNPLPAPHESATAEDRHHGPVTLGRARTGLPVSASGSNERNGRQGADARMPDASVENRNRVTRDPQHSAIETHRPETVSAPRGVERDGSVKQSEHAPIAGAAGPKKSIVRQTASHAPDSDRREHQPVHEIADGATKPAPETTAAIADREPTPSTRAQTSVTGSKKRDGQQAVSTDAAYKKVLRTRDERLPEDPKTAKLKDPDERVR